MTDEIYIGQATSGRDVIVRYEERPHWPLAEIQGHTVRQGHRQRQVLLSQKQ